MQSHEFTEILTTKATRTRELHVIYSSVTPAAMRKEIQEADKKLKAAKAQGRKFKKVWWDFSEDEDEYGHRDISFVFYAEEYESPEQQKTRIHCAKYRRAMQYLQDIARASFWGTEEGLEELKLIGKDILENFPAIRGALDSDRFQRLDVAVGERVHFDDPQGLLGKKHAYICNTDPDYFGGYACRWSKPSDGKTWKPTVVLSWYNLKKIQKKDAAK